MAALVTLSASKGFAETKIVLGFVQLPGSIDLAAPGSAGTAEGGGSTEPAAAPASAYPPVVDSAVRPGANANLAGGGGSSAKLVVEGGAANNGQAAPASDSQEVTRVAEPPQSQLRRMLSAIILGAGASSR
jgi:hypothetical protein